MASAPLGRVYRFIVPPPLRTGLENVGDNLRYPRRLVNNLLQGKWSDSWNETRRFAANTTLGMAGLYDPATEIWQITRVERGLRSDLRARPAGATAPTCSLPFLGPSTIRDGLGKIGDAAFSPLTYVPFASVADRFNDLSDEFEGLLRAVHSNYDAYQLGRVLYVLTREVDATDFSWKSDSTGEVETLARGVPGSRGSSAFPARAETHTVALFDDERRLPYSAWMQPEPATVVYLLPGLGAHRIGESSLGLAEAALRLRRLGGDVVLGDELRVHEGPARARPLPGPFCRAMRPTCIEPWARSTPISNAAIPDTPRGNPGSSSVSSLGGAHTLTNLLHGAGSGGRRAEVRPVRGARSAGRLALRRGTTRPLLQRTPWASPRPSAQNAWRRSWPRSWSWPRGRMEPTMDLPFTRLEAEYLIGLSFRATLQMVLLASQERYDQGILLTPRDLAADGARVPRGVRVLVHGVPVRLSLALLRRADTRSHARRCGSRLDLRAHRICARSNPHCAPTNACVCSPTPTTSLLGPDDRTWLQSVLGRTRLLLRRGWAPGEPAPRCGSRGDSIDRGASQ